ncbi:MAG TPA: hypothetical protein VLD61_05900 [Methylomirabilota bacterium]|nr:hypothetical protein [Methylomirabilota bacterium]
MGTLFDLILEFVAGIPTKVWRQDRPLPWQRFAEGALILLVVAGVVAFVWWRSH